MELCKHGDLKKFYQNNEQSHEQHLQIMTQIAAGVKYLHQNDVVLRDIKPENILFLTICLFRLNSLILMCPSFSKNLKHQP